jgi:hypothetical protein
VRPASRPVLTILIVFLISFAPAGCARSEDSQKTDDRSQESGASDSADEGRIMRLTPEGTARRGDDGSQARLDGREPTRSVDAQDSAFAAERLSAAPFYPIDVVIGPLRTSGLSHSELAARSAARSVLASVLRTGDVPRDELLEGRLSVELQLEELAGSGLPPESVRVGRPESLATGEMSVAFRLAGAEQSWYGELILEMAEGRWYTSDVQAAVLSHDELAGFVPGLDSATPW